MPRRLSPPHVHTAVALTPSSIRTIKKTKMLEILRKKNKVSNSLVAYLLAKHRAYQDYVAKLMTFFRRTAPRHASFCASPTWMGKARPLPSFLS